MFVAKNAWSALRRHPWRTVLTIVVSLLVTLWSAFGVAVLHEYDEAHGARYDQLTPLGVFTPSDLSKARAQGDNADSTKNYMTWDDYNGIGAAANEKNATFGYTLIDSVPVRGGDKLKPVAGAQQPDAGADETGGDFTLQSFLSEQAVPANSYGTYRIVDGKGLGYEDVTRHDLIMSKALADKNGIKVGDEVTLGNAKDAKTTYTYTVCGLYEYTAPAEGAAPFAKDVPDNVLYTTYYSFAADDLDPLDASGWQRPDVNVVFMFQGVEQYEAFKQAVKDVKLPSGYRLSSPTIDQYERSLEPLDSLASTMRLTLILLWSIGGALLLALTLLQALPRREEIGFALQVGVTKGRLAWQFMNEILWPTLLGAAIGLIIGCCTANPLAGNFVDGHSFTLPAALVWNLIWISAAGCLVLAAIAGVRVAAFPTAQLFASPYLAHDDAKASENDTDEGDDDAIGHSDTDDEAESTKDAESTADTTSTADATSTKKEQA